MLTTLGAGLCTLPLSPLTLAGREDVQDNTSDDVMDLSGPEAIASRRVSEETFTRATSGAPPGEAIFSTAHIFFGRGPLDSPLAVSLPIRLCRLMC